MRISTTCRNRIIRVLAVAFWIAVWQGVSLAVGSEILVASPARTFGALLSLLREGAFYRAVLGSLMRICAGFALALALGIALGALSFVVGWVRALLHPVVSVVKATPVASFVILALIWISSKNLSIFISFLMVFPIMYENMLAGLESADAKLWKWGRYSTFRAWRAFGPSICPRPIHFCCRQRGFRWACAGNRASRRKSSASPGSPSAQN